jgi:hypothetical protein
MANTFEALELFKRELSAERVNVEILFSDSKLREPIDGILLRFLRARQNHVKEALDLLQADVAWRKDQNIETLKKQTASEILGESAEPLLSLLPEELCGFDPEGRPVFFFDCKQCASLVKRSELPGLVKHHVWKREHLTHFLSRLADVTAEYVESFTLVMDFEGVAGSDPEQFSDQFEAFLEHVKATLCIDQQHYPERLHIMLPINLPAWIRSIWENSITPSLSARTVDKIHYLNCSVMHNDALLDAVGEDGLPEKYGGKRSLMLPWDSRVAHPLMLASVSHPVKTYQTEGTSKQDQQSVSEPDAEPVSPMGTPRDSFEDAQSHVSFTSAHTSMSSLYHDAFPFDAIRYSHTSDATSSMYDFEPGHQPPAFAHQQSLSTSSLSLNDPDETSKKQQNGEHFATKRENSLPMTNSRHTISSLEGSDHQPAPNPFPSHRRTISSLSDDGLYLERRRKKTHRVTRSQSDPDFSRSRSLPSLSSPGPKVSSSATTRHDAPHHITPSVAITSSNFVEVRGPDPHFAEDANQSRIQTTEDGLVFHMSEPFKRTTKLFDICNMVMLVFGVLVVAVSSAFWNQFYWAGELVEWVSWLGVAGVFLGTWILRDRMGAMCGPCVIKWVQCV